MSTGILSSFVRAATLNTKYSLCCRVVKNVYRFTSYEPDGKTTVNILNIDPGAGLLINSYSQIGFRLNNGMAVLGAMAIFPKTVLSWKVGSVEEINEESLSIFCCLEPKIDILILGVGDNYEFSKFNKDLIKFLRKKKINVETLPTETACTTFNFLNAERRYVAGALLPPNTIRLSEDYFATSKLRTKEINSVID